MQYNLIDDVGVVLHSEVTIGHGCRCPKTGQIRYPDIKIGQSIDDEFEPVVISTKPMDGQELRRLRSARISEDREFKGRPADRIDDRETQPLGDTLGVTGQDSTVPHQKTRTQPSQKPRSHS